MSMLENKLENEMAKMTNTVSSLQNSVSKLTDQFERKLLQIEQKPNRIASDRGAFENINANRSTSLFGQTLHGPQMLGLVTHLVWEGFSKQGR